jgi:hypothetical protein
VPKHPWIVEQIAIGVERNRAAQAQAAQKAAQKAQMEAQAKAPAQTTR